MLCNSRSVVRLERWGLVRLRGLLRVSCHCPGWSLQRVLGAAGGMRLGTILGGFVALGFIAVSTVMAGRFGYLLGSTEADSWLYAGAGSLADILKALLPLLIVSAWLARQYVR